jgi:regulatory protein YycI of two-component signal transduction system YycFG
MNNLFKIRKINKALKIFLDSFIGFSDKDIDQDLKQFYEKELQNNGINFKLNFP